jgi:hypothetical protein
MRLFPLFAFLGLVACATTATTSSSSTGASADRAPVFAPLADDVDCSLTTPLVPGVPGSPGHLVKSERNPNGDSELALIMRRFVDDLSTARALVEAGKPVPPMYPVHRRIRCAWPSKPEERNEGFDARAQGYLAAVRAFDAKPSQQTYDAIITNCIACHSVSCGGVIEFISSMRWK